MKNLIFFALFLFLFAGCSKDEATEEPIAIEEPKDAEAELTFAEVIAEGGDFEPYPASRTEEVLAESTPMNEDYEIEEEGGGTVTERSVCVTKTVSVLDGNGTFPLFNTNADVIYPGSLLQGKTLSDATPKPIVVGRAGGTISYDLNNGNTNSTFTVNEVSKSSIQDGMNNIIANAGQVVPANFQVDIIQVESESQMALEMGIKVETFTTEVEGSLSFSTEKEYNRTLVKVNQSYYTMSFDLPTSLDEIFGENVTPEQLQTYVQSDNPATFISSVTYGRIFYMLIESTSSRQEMQASLKATYDAVAINASGSLDVETFDSLKEVKIKAIAYGGDAEGSFQLLGETSIAAIANKIGASTDIKAGLPLSYLVRSVERPDEIVGVKLATEYDIVNCEVKGVLPPEAYRPLVDIFEDGIGAAFHVTGKIIVLYNKAGDKYAYYNVGSGEAPRIWDVSDWEGAITSNNISTGPIGAAVRWGEDRIHLFNRDGTKFLKFDYNSASSNLSSPTNPIGTIERNTDGSPKFFETSTFYANTLDPWTSFPFANDGIDAAIQYSNNATQRYFSNDGKSTTLLEFELPLNRWVWSESVAPNTVFGVDFFESVGAATKVQFGPTTQEILYFNGDGDQMMIQTQPNTINGPYFVN
ncbi:thiol-activated cytolysin family protein [Croceitalea vernalis]|uniref:Thiol-activated cytolysin family protein n=1 Tax=Croceitalea vernalis TaxID=3075599 RepID=A0ABU3BIT0_9FLAO|nr:thiol-activated cytolysin family protein [Croceitalea sp. P007]MDT0622015.1 thiol-activated cytolysin family protein [Croceitalea sp. P007]